MKSSGRNLTLAAIEKLSFAGPILVENNDAASTIGSTSSKSLLRDFEECRAAVIR
jgi:hypothetical protein